MADQLTFALITPYSLLKSRTGGIIARLLATGDLEFVSARMYAPSDAMVEELAATIEGGDQPADVRSLVADYVRHTFRRDNRYGISNRVTALLFRGEGAVRHLHNDVVGAVSSNFTGNTIRGTFGDFVTQQSGEVQFFEPAVITPATEAEARAQLSVLAKYARSDGGVLTDLIDFGDQKNVQTGLVILKPDNFAKRSALPGNIIDIFSRTGLYIVAAKLFRMSVEQAEEFYAPVRQVFVEKLAPMLEARVRKVLAGQFTLQFPEEAVKAMVSASREANADHEFRKIVNYMAGIEEAESAERVPSKCLALLYQGVNAIAKIRARLGATNPLTADAGTVRSIYGQDLMKNGAHASDSPENVERECRIIGLSEKDGLSDFEQAIRACAGRTP